MLYFIAKQLVAAAKQRPCLSKVVSPCYRNLSLVQLKLITRVIQIIIKIYHTLPIELLLLNHTKSYFSHQISHELNAALNILASYSVIFEKYQEHQLIALQNA